MPRWPDASSVRRFLVRAGRRRIALAAIEGAAAGLIVGSALTLFVWLAMPDRHLTGWDSLRLAPFVGLAAAAAGAALRALSSWRARRRVPYLVEQRAPAFRNLLITASELLDDPGRVKPELGERIFCDTARVMTPLELSQIFPARRAAGALLVCSACWVAVVLAEPPRPGTATAAPEMLAGEARLPAIQKLSVMITPPGYAGGDAVSFDEPSTVEALQGSRITISVAADAATVSLQTARGDERLTAGADGLFRGELIADEDGFVALQPATADGVAGALRLVGLTVVPDLAPHVRITAPGQDLFLPDATSRLAVGLEANDDIGLVTLAVTYTKVTGSGENFEFATGELALDVSRADDRSWSATGTLELGTLGLEPGDMVVYRGLATDGRPGAPPAESDAFIIEILAPGEAAAGGFAIDDREDRYALSQRMVIIRTERLAARASSLSSQEVAEEAFSIAAEQRQVRAEFVFMMGGELTDFEGVDPFVLHEEDEAHGEADIAAGRLANQGRAELTRAVRSMSEAASALAAPDLGAALTAEQAALEALQRAFSQSRYILRTLTERESIDLERRMTGALTDLARGALPGSGETSDPRANALRRALADMSVTGRTPPERWQPATLVALARTLLDIDPGSETLRTSAGSMADAARALERGDPMQARALFDDATATLAAEARAALPVTPAGPGDPAISRLLGAQADAIRRAGGGR